MGGTAQGSSGDSMFEDNTDDDSEPEADQNITFRSALGNENLDAIICQFAMCDEEAKVKLATDPSLTHLYDRRYRGYQPAGVEVTGAGCPSINGWYHRRKAREGPPRGWGFDYMPSEPYGADNWVKDSAHYYYEKITDNGNCVCNIGSTTSGRTWIITTIRP